MQDLGSRCRRQPARGTARRTDRRRRGSRRTGGGAGRPHPARSPRGSRGRRYDGATPRTGNRPSRDPGRAARRRRHPRPSSKAADPRDRGPTATRATWRPARGSAPWPRSGASAPSGLPPDCCGLAVHLIYIVGFKSRVTTLLHWTSASSAAPARSAPSPHRRYSLGRHCSSIAIPTSPEPPERRPSLPRRRQP